MGPPKRSFTKFMISQQTSDLASFCHFKSVLFALIITLKLLTMYDFILESFKRCCKNHCLTINCTTNLEDKKSALYILNVYHVY